ncbi:hypothetical protein AGRA3207_002084 [Actinomadura graeca]|uniref:Uncharacterized protein n=1 Tax=Actinomadura graeca TaxID=2750812 RepID=A0ABX8QU37_9ACTN|nr:hypothetical protein [Actinomadura graeca]QXJ21247.1 hypothetical protein AGRA3207_002084 [Actinomadura graeca]
MTGDLRWRVRVEAGGQVGAGILAHHRGPSRLGDVITRMPARDLVEAAAEPPAERWLIGPVCAELQRRKDGAEAEPALRHHGYLADQLAAVHPGRGDVQVRQLTGLLAACYGPALSPEEFDRVVGAGATLPPAPLLGAALALYGPGAGERLLTVTLAGMFADAGFDEETLGRLRRALGEDRPPRRPRR